MPLFPLLNLMVFTLSTFADSDLSSCARALSNEFFPTYSVTEPYLFDSRFRASSWVRAKTDFEHTSTVNKEKAGKLVAEKEAGVIPEIIADLRRDIHLSGLSKKELYEAAMRVPNWKFYLSNIDTHPRTTEAALEMERYRLRLIGAGIDPAAKPKSFASMLAQFGINTLAHNTTLDHALEALKLGKLVPHRESGRVSEFIKNSGYDWNQNVVYLEAPSENLRSLMMDPEAKRRKYSHYMTLKYEDWANADFDLVCFELAAETLDHIPWSHMSVYWLHGQFVPESSIQPSNLIAGFFNLVRNSGGQITDTFADLRNEFIFTKAIPLTTYLRAIHVHTKRVDEIKERLRQMGVDEETVKLVR